MHGQPNFMPSAPSLEIQHLSVRRLLPPVRRALARFALVGVSPIVAFYLAFRFLGPIEGILAGTATATLALTIQAFRMRRFDPIGVVPIFAVLIQGGLGIAFQSVDLYLAAPALETSLWGVALLISVAVGRPFVLLAANELNLLPSEARRMPSVKRALKRITIVWGLMAFVKSGIRLGLLETLELEVFLIANTLIITSLNLVLLAFTIWYPLRVARRQLERPTGISPSIA